MAEHLINSESIYVAGVFPDMTTLKTLNTNSLPQGIWAYVEESFTGEYYLDRNSTLNESTPNVIEPNSGPGRWLKKENTIVSNYNLLKQIALSGVNPEAFLKFASGYGIDSTVTGAGILNIGTSNADVINLGNVSTTINIPGTLAYNDVTNLEVTDKTIILNHGGAAGSGMGAGIEIEEGGSITGYIKVDSDREGFEFKAPAVDYTATFDFSELTSNRVFQFPDEGGMLALASDIPTEYSNGLTNNSGNVQIGGELTHHTYINSDTDGAWRWEIGSSKKLAWFEVYARNDVWFEYHGIYDEFAQIILDNAGISFSTNHSIQYAAQLRTDNLTTARIIQFPDAAGTLALASDVPESFSNGLVLDSGNVKIGGMLTQHTYIDSDTNDAWRWIMGNTNKLSWFEVYAMGDIWFEYHGTSNEFAQIILDNAGISLSTNYALQYAAKLRTDNMTAERVIQFPDAAGTLALASDIPESFSNGLVLDSGNVKLGGTLTENTAINAETDDSIRFEMGSGTRLYWFEIYARADIWLETVSAEGGDMGRLLIDNQGVSINTNPSIPGLYGVYGASLRTDDLTDHRIFQFPDEGGTFALASDIPESFANGLVLDSGNVKLGGTLTENTAINAEVDDSIRFEMGSGTRLYWFEIYARADIWLETVSAVGGDLGRLIVDNQGVSINSNPSIPGLYGVYGASLRTDDLTDHRIFQFPDEGGTFALTSDLSSYLPLTGGTISGNLTMSTATASTIAEFDSSKNLVGTKAIISAYLTSGSTTTLLENNSNWTSKTYTGTTITGTYQGQKWIDSNYLYEAIDDNVWIRLTRA